MTKEEIVEANIIFARYLGYEYYPKIGDEKHPGWRICTSKILHPKLKSNWYLCRNHNDLPFYRDRNWLLKVLKKYKEDFNFILLNQEQKMIYSNMSLALNEVNKEKVFENLVKLL